MTRRGCSARPMPRCTRSSGVRRTAWRGGGERPRAGEARSATRSGRAGSAHRLLPLLQRLQLEGVAPRPEEAEPHPRLVEVVRRRTRVARALDAHHRHLQLGPGLRQLERARDAPLPLLHARDADAVVVGQVGLLRLQRRERAPELRVAPPQAGERVEHRPRRRRRAEVERAAVQVVAQAVADEMRLAHDERPREERLDARAETVHVLGRDAVVVVVPRIHAPRIAGARGACERCLDALAPWLLVSPSWQPCSMASRWWRWRTGASSPPPAPRWATGARRW